MYVQWPYLGVLAVLILCSLGLPLPEDVPLLTGGVLCHEGYAQLHFMIPVALAGVLAGDFILFGIGRRFGPQVTEHRFVRRLVKPDRLRKAEFLFEQHGVKIIFICRFLPGLRPMMFMASGVLRVPLWKFAVVNGLAASISVPTIVLLGNIFAERVARIQHGFRTATHIVVLVMILAGLAIAGVYVYRRQRRMMASVDDDTRTAQGADGTAPQSEDSAGSDAVSKPGEKDSSRQSKPTRQAKTA